MKFAEPTTDKPNQKPKVEKRPVRNEMRGIAACVSVRVRGLASRSNIPLLEAFLVVKASQMITDLSK